MRRPQVDPEVLIEFLDKYEPELAEKTSAMRNEKPDDFRRRLPILGKLYGPLIEEMKFDPTMTQLKVARIRLHLRAKAGVDMIKDSEDNELRTAGEKQLREAVADLFDNIMEQQKLKYDRVKTQLDERVATAESKGMNMMAEEMAGDDAGEKRGTGKAGKGKDQSKNRLRQVHRKLEKHQEMLNSWRNNKESIIEKRVEDMRSDAKPFPWGR